MHKITTTFFDFLYYAINHNFLLKKKFSIGFFSGLSLWIGEIDTYFRFCILISRFQFYSMQILFFLSTKTKNYLLKKGLSYLNKLSEVVICLSLTCWRLVRFTFLFTPSSLLSHSPLLWDVIKKISLCIIFKVDDLLLWNCLYFCAEWPLHKKMNWFFRLFSLHLSFRNSISLEL